MKESDKINNYLDLSRELRKWWNMWVEVIPVVVGTLGTVLKGLKRGMEEIEIRWKIKTIRTTALMTTARILESWRHEETYYYSDSNKRPSDNANSYLIVMLYGRDEETTILVYKKYKSLLYYHEKVEMTICMRDKHRETEACYDWHYVGTDIFQSETTWVYIISSDLIYIFLTHV